MEKFKNKYRISSHRRPNWDYSGDGYYFITIAVQGRECYLGEIVENEMILSDFGKIVKYELLKSFKIRKELLLDEYVIMPNHIHVIVILKKTQVSTSTDCEPNHNKTTNNTDNKRSTHVSQHKLFKRLPKSISSFIGGLKSTVNSKIDDFIDENNLNMKKFNKNNHFFQPNYHDHIIRNDAEYKIIANYIKDNPKLWKDDQFYSI